MSKSDIKYLVGSEEITCRPLPIFSDIAIKFLDDLSKELRNDTEARKFSDVMTFAFWCRKANIVKLKEEYAIKFPRIGKGIAFHIAPSNVPINFVFSYAFGVLAGNGNVVRVSEKDFRQIKIVCRILNKLFENQEYVFHNGDKTIRMIYDQTIKGTDENPRDELSNQNSTSNKPDIVIMVYENDVIKNCIILEVKCRRKNNIYVRTGDTPVFSQLKDYTNFWYFDSKGNLDKNVLKKVYAIFPQEDSCKEDLNANQICLLSLRPVYDYENDASYMNLFDEITAYI